MKLQVEGSFVDNALERGWEGLNNFQLSRKPSKIGWHGQRACEALPEFPKNQKGSEYVRDMERLDAASVQSQDSSIFMAQCQR